MRACQPTDISMVALLLLLFLIGSSEASSCSFTKTFPSGGSLDTDAVEGGYNAAANSITSCSVSCDSGSRVSVYLRYGGAASILFHDASDFSLSGCDMTLTFSSSDEETELGWALSASNSFSNLKLTCSCSSVGTGNPDDGLACFSESATVQVLHKGQVEMRYLQVGDKVLTGKNQYQPVYSFGHRHETQEKEFLQIYTQSKADSNPLEMTGDHMIFVYKDGKEQVVRADTLQVGDQLIQLHNQHDNITKISSIQKKGVYMPLTPDGTIMVNGLKTSIYVSIADKIPSVLSHSAMFGFDSEQTIHQWWTCPYRMLCLGVSSNFCNRHNQQGISNWLVLGRDWGYYAERQSFLIQVVFLGIPSFAAFALLNLTELLVGPTFAPSFVAVLVAGLILWMRRRRRPARMKLD